MSRFLSTLITLTLAANVALAADFQLKSLFELKPSGHHVMLMELRQPLKQGESVPVTLSFEKAGTVEIKAAVGSMGADRMP